MVSAADLLAAEAHEAFLVDELEAQRRVSASVEDEPCDACAVVGVIGPLGTRSFQLEQHAARLLILLTSSPATTNIYAPLHRSTS